MKRFLALIITGGLSLSLFGCTQNAVSVGGTTSTATTTVISADAITDETASNESTSSTSEEEVKPGSVSETTYDQPYFGFKVTLEEPWTYSDATDLTAQEHFVIRTAEDERVLEALAKGNLFIDMAANNPKTFNSLMVRVVKLNLADFFLEEETLYSTYLSLLRDDVTAAGLTDLEDQTGRITFLGEETRYVGVKGKVALSDAITTEMYNYCIICKKGNYACLIYFSGIPEFGSESFEALAAHFRKA